MDDAFTLRVLPDDRAVRVGTEEPLLTAVLAAGIDAPCSCRLGYCGTCVARLLAGTIEYPSGRVVSALEAAQLDGIMLCIARARSDLTIELRLLR